MELQGRGLSLEVDLQKVKISSCRSESQIWSCMSEDHKISLDTTLSRFTSCSFLNIKSHEALGQLLRWTSKTG